MKLPTRLLGALMLTIVIASAERAQAARGEFPAVKPLMAARVTAMEREIASLILRRTDTPAAQQAVVDLQIDLRVLERWLLVQASDAPAESDHQIQTYLRSYQMATAATALEDLLRQSPKALTHTQSEAMVKLHQITYNLPDFKNPKSGDAKGQPTLDSVCQEVGAAMLNVVSPQPVDPATVPQMRPRKVLRSAITATAPEPPGEGPRTVDQMMHDLLRAAVSVPVRQQLLALASQATAAASEPGADSDAALLKKTLGDAVTLATGMASNTAIPQATREAIDGQLAEGLALFSDPRTRSAGQTRIDGLSQYRQLMSRVSRLPLTPEQRQAFSPAFGYAQNNVEQGGRVLAAIDQYLALTTTFSAIPKRDNTPANLKNATDAAQKQFESQRDAFNASATALGGATFSAGPDNLEGNLKDMQQALDLYETIYDLPPALEILNVYKPRPFGAIETRAVKACVNVTTTAPKALGHAEAQKFLTDIVKLARSADELVQHSVGASVPQSISVYYAGGQLTEFEAKCNKMIGELASQLAAGVEMDKAKLARLQAAREIEDGLRNAIAFDASLQGLAPFQRWADWQMTAEQLRTLCTPYQQAMSSAISGMIGDAPDPVDRFIKLQPAYVPLMKFIAAEAGYAQECAALPVGFGAEVAKLMTPMDGRLFYMERYVSYATAMWGSAQSDADAASAVANALNRRLSRELHLGGKGTPTGYVALRRPSETPR